VQSENIVLNYDDNLKQVTLTVSEGYSISFGDIICNALGLTKEAQMTKPYLPHQVFQFGEGTFSSPKQAPSLRSFRNDFLCVCVDFVEQQIINSRYENFIHFICCDREQKNDGNYYRYESRGTSKFMHDLNCNKIRRINVQVRDELGDVVKIMKDTNQVSELAIVLEFKKNAVWNF
jgi:hypothetical protein